MKLSAVFGSISSSTQLFKYLPKCYSCLLAIGFGVLRAMSFNLIGWRHVFKNVTLFVNWITPIAGLLVILACSSEIGNPEPGEDIQSLQINGLATKGPIAKGLIQFFILNDDGSRGEMLASWITNNDGTFSGVLSYSGPIEVSVTQGQYSDEATGIDTQIENHELIAVAASLSSFDSFVISPLTTIAASYIKFQLSHQNPTSFENIIDDAYQAVAFYFGLPGINVHRQRPADLTQDLSVNQEESAKRHGSVLAAMSQAIQNENRQPGEVFALIKALSSDFEDGVIDGLDGYGQAVETDQILHPPRVMASFKENHRQFLESSRNHSRMKENDFIPDIPAPDMMPPMFSSPQRR